MQRSRILRTRLIQDAEQHPQNGTTGPDTTLELMDLEKTADTLRKKNEKQVAQAERRPREKNEEMNRELEAQRDLNDGPTGSPDKDLYNMRTPTRRWAQPPRSRVTKRPSKKWWTADGGTTNGTGRGWANQDRRARQRMIENTALSTTFSPPKPDLEQRTHPCPAESDSPTTRN